MQKLQQCIIVSFCVDIIAKGGVNKGMVCYQPRLVRKSHIINYVIPLSKSPAYGSA